MYARSSNSDNDPIRTLKATIALPVTSINAQNSVGSKFRRTSASDQQKNNLLPIGDFSSELKLATC
jgi:hypothetical protein